ncbi:hypothetical protein BDZ90DRAFT_229150 [Jaminaea rosea]|uniref:Apple domain-containing protein n=1 Tax=Jaminaea rosea TaxID=1569628 RepID=A0A316V1R6_9BASI|nr:hypothetical protein BDZ90DRAFT_229150 [Jaminaea rosea]PWN30123.1 hypothetical protein BDZ90DRAFT_229150 [Jaminaea rosea]
MFSKKILATVCLALAVCEALASQSSHRKNGQTCTDSYQCASNSCQYSKCATKLSNWSKCYKDNMCQSDSCAKVDQVQRCVPTSLQANGQRCSESSQCRSQSCQYSKCAEKRADLQTCYKDNMCRSGKCGALKGHQVCLPSATSKSSSTKKASSTTSQDTTSATRIISFSVVTDPGTQVISTSKLATSTVSTDMTSSSSLSTSTAPSTATPPALICGVAGYRSSNEPEGASLTYTSLDHESTQSECAAQCLADSQCMSYFIGGAANGFACATFTTTAAVELNPVPGAANVIYDRDCPVSEGVSSTASISDSSTSSMPTPTATSMSSAGAAVITTIVD